MTLKDKIRICPKCGSVDTESKVTILQAAGVPFIITCNSCSYQGYIFPEVPKNKIKEFQKDIKKFNKK